MADANSYPQIPTTVWWGLRPILKRKPNAKVDDDLLGIELGVQGSAAKQYIKELQKVRLLNEEGLPTPLAAKWRMDDSYKEAAEEILNSSYPEALLNLAPFGSADRNKVVEWFMRQGLGEGTARNKAATYVLIANEDIQEAGEARPSSRPREQSNAPQKRPTQTKAAAAPESAVKAPTKSEVMPLNVNVQIHIGADASKDQIETIFASMRKYLYTNEDN